MSTRPFDTGKSQNISQKAENYKMNYIEMIRGITDFDIDVLCIVKKIFTKDADIHIKNENDTPIKQEEIKKEEGTSDDDYITNLNDRHQKPTTVKIEPKHKFSDDTENIPPRDASIQFGQKMHPFENVDEDTFNNEEKSTKTYLEITKTQSLIHSEAIVFMLISNNISRLIDDSKDGLDYSMFGTFLHFLIHDTKIKTLEDILDMIDASNLPEIRILYMHIASIVAFHHYIRVEVHRTGNYKAKKTIDLLESYKIIMILGLLKTNLSMQGTTYLKDWGKRKS